MREEMTGLTWEKVYEEFNKLIRYAANDVAFQYKTTYQSSEDLYQDGLIILYNCLEKYSDKSLEEFGAIFRTSLWRGQRKNAKVEMVESMRLAEHLPAKCGKVGVTTDDETNETASSIDIEGQMFENETFNRIIGNDESCRIVLNELVNPSERTLWEQKMDYARKQRTGYQGLVKDFSKFKISNVHLARALNLSPGALEVILNKIKLAYSKLRPEMVTYKNKTEEAKLHNQKQDWRPFSCDTLKQFLDKKGLSYVVSENQGVQKMRLIEALRKINATPEMVESCLGTSVEKVAKPVWKKIATETLVAFAQANGVEFVAHAHPSVNRMRVVASLNEANFRPEDL